MPPSASSPTTCSTRMYDAPGIGLAAIQVGEPLRMLVIDLAKEGEEPAPHVFINPEIVASVRRALGLRGRLPVDPGLLCRGRAPGAACASTISTGTARQQEIEAEGLLATCLQHEIDHLNGVLFIDHISKLKRDMVVQEFKQARQGQAGRRAGGLKAGTVALRLIFMGTPDFAVPTLRGRRCSRPFARRGLYPAAAAGRHGAGSPSSTRPSPSRARAAGHRGAHARGLRRRGRAEGVSRSSRPMLPWSSPMACCCRRPILDCDAARLLQRPCFAFAALAWRRADPARHHGRRPRDGHDGHEDGCRTGHRPGRACRSNLPIGPDDDRRAIAARSAARIGLRR